MAPVDPLLMSNYLPISLLRHLGTQSQGKRGDDHSDFFRLYRGVVPLWREMRVHGMIRRLVSALSGCWPGIFLSNYNLEICCILEETNLTRKLKIHGPKIKRSRKAPEELARRTRTRHWFVTLVFL